MTLCSDGNSLCGLWLENQKYYGGTIKEDMVECNKLSVFDQTKSWLDRYFAGKKPEYSEISLTPQGSEFRQKVWKILCQIPYGEVRTYGDIAIEMSSCKTKMSAQAIGGAVGHNPILIIIPCHRVIGSDGSLCGYAGGLEIKKYLLEFEKEIYTKSRLYH